jgi:hypothetical protein
MATFNNSGAYSILNTQKGTYYVQGGHYFSPTTFVDLGTTAPTDYQSLSSERSDDVSITGGALDGVTVGPNSTIQASVSGSVTNATITNPTLTGGSINGTPIGQETPAAGAFLGLNATSAGILGPLAAEGVNSTANGQAASVTNTGTNLSSTFSALTFFDSSRTANNKTSEIIWSSGLVTFRFKNDAGGSVLPWLIASGGQASGITSINSNSGSGVWTHTGGFVATGAISAGDSVSANAVQLLGSSGAADTQIRALGNTADISVQIQAKGTGTIKLMSAASVAGAFSATGAINSSVGLTVKEGTNAKQGTATLAAGTVTVANTSVTANSRILLTVQSLGTVTDPKAVAVTARVVGTSFTIRSADATDTSVVAYEIFEPGA